MTVSAISQSLNFLLFGISLVFVAIFAAYEIAYVTIDRRRLVLWFPGKMGHVLMEYPERILTADLIGTNIASVSAAIFLTKWFMELMDSEWAVGFAGIGATATIVLFGEILPKNFARGHRELVVKKISPLIYGIYTASLFFIVPLESMLRRYLIKKESRGELKDRGKHEIENLIIHGRERGVISEEEAMMLSTALYFYENKADRFITPIKTVPAMPISSSLDEFIKTARENEESWIIVYGKKLDDILGYVKLRELLYLKASMEVEGREAKIDDVIVSPVFVYKEWPIKRIIYALKEADRELAIVLDEYGSIAGVIEREKIFSELLDALYNYEIERIEHSREEIIRVDGDTPLETLREMGINIPSEEEHSVVSGLILSYLMGKEGKEGSQMPRENASVTIGDYVFIVEEVDESGVIKKVLIKKKGGDMHGKETV